MKTKITIALVGCGTVGSALASHLLGPANTVKQRSGVEIKLKHICSRTYKKANQAGLPKKLFTSDFDQIVDDKEVDLVVELIGGVEKAADIIEKSLKAGKHVVTANKALIAQRGPELLALARQNRVCLAFEAACAAGIPILRALYDGLAANRVDAIYGILNGTCNFILTEMSARGKTYKEALAEAQQLGFAEADPTLDVSGGDTAHKLAILSSLGFGCRIEYEGITVSGIDNLDLSDVAIGDDLGYVIKLLAVAQRGEEGINLRVRPAFISSEHPLAWIPGPFNAISVYSRPAGHMLFYGRGAGGLPTASAVIADIQAIANGSYERQFSNLTLWSDKTEPAALLPVSHINSRYYVRAMVPDESGVLGKLTTGFGDQGISISSVLQYEASEDQSSGKEVPVVITTHKTEEKRVNRAIAGLEESGLLLRPAVCINIVDEHAEEL